MKRDPNTYPKGWNRKKVEAVLAHYDKQTDEEAIAEADVAWENSRMSLVRVPAELVEQVRAFVATKTGRGVRGRSAGRKKKTA